MVGMNREELFNLGGWLGGSKQVVQPYIEGEPVKVKTSTETYIGRYLAMEQTSPTTKVVWIEIDGKTKGIDVDSDTLIYGVDDVV